MVEKQFSIIIDYANHCYTLVQELMEFKDYRELAEYEVELMFQLEDLRKNHFKEKEIIYLNDK